MLHKNNFFTCSVQNIISLSGGKDSLALWLLACERNIENITVVFADTGHEHPLTYEYILLLEQKLCPVIRVRADFRQRIINKRHYVQTVWPIKLVEKYGYTPQGAEQRVREALEQMVPRHIPFLDLCIWKGRFPSTRARFCTFQLKHRPSMNRLFSRYWSSTMTLLVGRAYAPRNLHPAPDYQRWSWMMIISPVCMFTCLCCSGRMMRCLRWQMHSAAHGRAGKKSLLMRWGLNRRKSGPHDILIKKATGQKKRCEKRSNDSYI